MAIQPLSPMPTPPLPTDPEDVFDEHAGTSLTAQVTFTNEMNANVIPGINAAATQVSADALYAGQAADRAEDQVALAAGQVALAAGQATLSNTARVAAEAARDSAQVFAAAAGSAAGLPTLAGNGGKVLTVNANGTAVAYADVLKVGQVTVSPQAPDATHLPLDGKVYLQSTYAAIFQQLGILGGIPAQNWSAVTSGVTGTPVDIASNSLSGVVISLFSNGSAMRSTDRGATWSALTINTGFTAGGAIACDNAGTWVVAGTGAGGAYRSADDGLTWTQIASLGTAGATINRIGTDTSGTWLAVFSTTSSTLSRSTDNGVTWSSITTGASAIHGQPATDGQGVWCVGTGTTMRRSTDNGVTWVQINFAFAAAQTVLATDRHGTWMSSGTTSTSATYRSVDNGLTWVLQVTGLITANMLDMIYVTGYFVVMRSASPQIAFISAAPDASLFLSATTGVLTSGTRLSHAGGGAINAVSTVNANTLRALPTFSYDTVTQFKVPDWPVASGLRAWIKAGTKSRFLPYRFSPISVVSGAKASMAYGNSDGGLVYCFVADDSAPYNIFRSADGGKSWSTVATTATAPIIGIATNRQGDWVAITSGGQLFRSADNGLTWPLALQISGNDFSLGPTVAFDSASGVVLLRTSQRVLRSTDKGSTWSVVLTGLGGLATGLVSNGSGLWLVGDSNNSSIRRSTDNGLTWSSPIALDAGTSWIRVIAPGKDGCFIASSPANTYRSTNSGLSWTLISDSNPNQYLISSVANGYFIRYSGGLAATSVDNGVSWINQGQLVPETSTSRVIFIAGESNPWLGIAGPSGSKTIYQSQAVAITQE